MKTCEICDRPIKTGRKYCWKHRHTAQAEAIRGDKIIDESTRAYYRYKRKMLDKVLFPIFGFYYFILAVILWFLRFKSPAFTYVFIFGVIPGPIVAIIIAQKYFGVKPRYSKTILEDIIFRKPRYYKQISEDINNRHPEYVQWVKGWVQDEKEEREFRKSLLK